jgi:chorismate--pyruvate lyase
MPKWLDPYCLPRGVIPVELTEWLFLAGSMTAKLRALCQSSFSVNVLAHDWNCPRLDEWQALNIRQQPAIVRETFLVCDHKEYIFARSVFPKCALIGKGSALLCLGNKPIGDIIYNGHHLVRRNLQIAKLYPGQQDYESAVSILAVRPTVLWARRAIIEFNHNPLLISEVFLPAIYTP